MKIAKLTNQLSVSHQIEIADIKQIKSLGFCAIICNRPDGEIEEMPSFEDIEKAANEENIKCYYIPNTGPQAISKEMIIKTKAALENSNGLVLAYCRTGTRSTILWALAQKEKMGTEKIIKIAKDAGYDISFLSDRLI
ncbi:MAG: TIGR01244 family sulfur transferase [Devosiaceae bacterium]|nr:TIGR01244 family sulfur transferase [Devosiaceae bacterium]